MIAFFTATKMYSFMLKDPFNEQIVGHKELIFFALQFNVISHQQHSRMVNIALFYVYATILIT